MHEPLCSLLGPDPIVIYSKLTDQPRGCAEGEGITLGHYASRPNASVSNALKPPRLESFGESNGVPFWWVSFGDHSWLCSGLDHLRLCVQGSLLLEQRANHWWWEPEIKLRFAACKMIFAPLLCNLSGSVVSFYWDKRKSTDQEKNAASQHTPLLWLELEKGFLMY